MGRRDGQTDHLLKALETAAAKWAGFPVFLGFFVIVILRNTLVPLREVVFRDLPLGSYKRSPK